MKAMLPLEETERHEIQAALPELKTGKEVLRAVVVLLLSIWPAQEVASVLGIPLKRLYRWANRYRMEKLKGFADKPRPGRPVRRTAEVLDWLQQTVAQSPQELGYGSNNWTCQLLRQVLALSLKLQASAEWVRRALHQAGFSWKRPKHQPPVSPDPLKEEKLAAIAEVQNNLKPNEVLLYEDEADFNLFCSLRSCWQAKGRQKEIPTPGRNKKVFVFGAYDPQHQRFIYEVRSHKRSRDFVAFLHHLLQVYPPQTKLYLVLDNFIVHKSHRVEAFCQRYAERLKFLFLPTYSPQENRIERVWGTVKGWVNSNHLYPSKESMVKAVRQGLRRFQTFIQQPQAA